jgi:hypothetical protein
MSEHEMEKDIVGDKTVSEKEIHEDSIEDLSERKYKKKHQHEDHEKVHEDRDGK